jgi:hypothetical protein
VRGVGRSMRGWRLDFAAEIGGYDLGHSTSTSVSAS